MGVAQALRPRPIVPLPGQWTFWADLMVGGAALGPVDVANFSATSKLSDFGSGTVTIVLPCGIDPARIVRLWSWRLWAFYAGTPVWCGVPTGITDHSQASVDLTLTELPGYLTKRMMDWSPSKVYAQIEQTTIASDIATPLLDLSRCTIQVVPGGGFKRDRTYEYLANTRATELTNLSQVISGPEFRPEYSVSGGIPSCSFKIAYPRVGSGAAGLGVVVPGETLDYQQQWDSDQLRTRTFAVGDTLDTAPANTAKPVSVVDRPQSDLPRLDCVDDWPGVVLTTTLAEKSNLAATQQASPALVVTASPALDFPAISTYRVGDDVSVVAVTPLIPQGQVVAGRLTQIDMDAAGGKATWTVHVTTPQPRIRRTLARRLDYLEQFSRGIYHGGPLAIQ